MSACYMMPRVAATLRSSGPLRHFTTSCRRHAVIEPPESEQSHYDVLQLPPYATPVQIKKFVSPIRARNHPLEV